MTASRDHAAPEDIAARRSYRSRVSACCYRVESVFEDEAGCRTVNYIVMGGPLHESRGQCPLAEFAGRVRDPRIAK